MKTKILLVVSIFVSTALLSGCEKKKCVILKETIEKQHVQIIQLINKNGELEKELLQAKQLNPQIDSLKKLPQYKNAIFLPQTKIKNYLSFFLEQERAKEFNTQKEFLETTEKTVVWDASKGETVTRSLMAKLEIASDTNQSFYPIAKFSTWNNGVIKDKNGKRTHVERNGIATLTIAEFFYDAPKNIGYVVINSKSTIEGGEGDYSSDLSLFEEMMAQVP